MRCGLLPSMDLLVLGGTAWLGREVAAHALSNGHHVTCLARGEAGEVVDGVRLVRADRDHPDAYTEVGEQRWDAVLDVARQPGHVRRAVAALEPVSGCYGLVSSVNVYAGQAEIGAAEDAALLPALADDEMPSMEQYGEAKVACEQAVLAGFGPERSLIARAGLLGGPGDTSGRSGYWPWRFSAPSGPDGAVLVPDEPDLPTAVIDVRDLAAWLVEGLDAGTSGVFNANGTAIPLADHLTVAREVAGHTGPLVAASTAWLLEQDVGVWMGPRSLPLWLDDPEWHGMNARSNGRALAAGLRLRPLARTLADVLEWERARPLPGPHGAGLTDDEEQTLLAVLRPA